MNGVFNHTSFHTHCIMLCGLSLKEQTNRTKSNENNKQKYTKEIQKKMDVKKMMDLLSCNWKKITKS